MNEDRIVPTTPEGGRRASAPATGQNTGPGTVPGTEPSQGSHTLPPGTVIGGLTITGLIGEGGFGIVYLAYDATLQRQVALKEYMPTSLASRTIHSGEVTVRSANYVDTFNAGLRSFVNEARLLARFDHPALVKVHQFWQANKTAYMVMPYYQGLTLKAHVKAEAAAGRRPDEATLRAWLTPLLAALEVMHAEQCYHRDIAPDNILLTPHGPLLLDFGAARRVISDMTHALTVILKPGYAPIEQYGEAATMTQGPWTDLYALASVVYFAVTGHSPITSVERLMGDPLPRLADEARGQYGETFLEAIDAALAVKPAERPQSVAEFRALLAGTAKPRTPPRTVTGPAAAPAYAALVAEPPAPPAPAAAPSPVAAPAAAAAVPAPARSGGSGRVVLVALLVLGAGVAWYALKRGDAPPVPAATAPAPEAAPAPTPSPEPSAAAAAPAEPPPPSPAAESKIEPVVVPALSPRPAPAAPRVRTEAPVRETRPAAAPVPSPTPAPVPTPSPQAVQASPPAPRPAPPAPSAAPAPAPAPAAAQSPRVQQPPGKPARCAELLQKGSQGTLSLDEATFLRNECR